MNTATVELGGWLQGHRRKGDKVLVVGLGNELRGDDGVGCLVARAAEELGQGAPQGRLDGLDAGISIENAGGAVRRSGARGVLLVDAVRVEGEPLGSWRMYPTEDLDSVWHTTHSVPLSLIVRAWRQDLEETDFAFLGVAIGETWDFAPVSGEVSAAVEEIRRVLASSLAEERPLENAQKAKEIQ